MTSYALMLLILEDDFNVVRFVVYENLLNEDSHAFTGECVGMEDVVHRKTCRLVGKCGFDFVYLG